MVAADTPSAFARLGEHLMLLLRFWPKSLVARKLLHRKDSLKCRPCRKGRHALPVRTIMMTDARQITPYKWVHPDEER
jgi:hypothetical protein